jgi:hypothetical protein
LGLIAFVVICGGALLPDMDNLKEDGGSSATWDLGVFGSIVSSIMVTVSSIVTSIFRGRGDNKPDTQHRYFWHTLLVPVVMFLLVCFCVPGGDTRVLDLVDPRDLSSFDTSVIVLLFFVFVSAYVGLCLLLRKANKLPFVRVKASVVSLVLSVVIVAVLLFSDCNTLQVVGICLCLGYLFHLVGDLFADSGIPALFPFTGLLGKFWMRISLLPRALTVSTGSSVESLLKVVFTIVALLLAVVVFAPGVFDLLVSV